MWTSSTVIHSNHCRARHATGLDCGHVELLCSSVTRQTLATTVPSAVAGKHSNSGSQQPRTFVEGQYMLGRAIRQRIIADTCMVCKLINALSCFSSAQCSYRRKMDRRAARSSQTAKGHPHLVSQIQPRCHPSGRSRRSACSPEGRTSSDRRRLQSPIRRLVNRVLRGPAWGKRAVTPAGGT